MFRDRADAGRQLLARLGDVDPDRTVVISLPRGGVPVAEVIADSLGTPLDIAIVRKVGLPGQKELAVGAISDGKDPKLVVNEDVARMAGLSRERIRELAEPEIAEAERRRQTYMGGRQPVPVEGKTVIVVDDGIATGSTMRAALGLIRAREPERIILAIPVAPEGAPARFSEQVDEMIFLETPRHFGAVGLYYADFDQVADEVVAEALARNRDAKGQSE